MGQITKNCGLAPKVRDCTQIRSLKSSFVALPISLDRGILCLRNGDGNYRPPLVLLLLFFVAQVRRSLSLVGGSFRIQER